MTPVKGSFVSPKGCDLHVENHCPNMTLPSTEQPGYKMEKAQSVLLCREEMKKGIVASSSCPKEGQETETNTSPSPKTGKPGGCRKFFRCIPDVCAPHPSALGDLSKSFLPASGLSVMLEFGCQYHRLLDFHGSCA